MTAEIFRGLVTKLLDGMQATEIEIEDGETKEILFVGCSHKGEKYELSIAAADEAGRERARDLVLDAVRRFADGK